ncbi:MAG: phosphate-starvation-inducible PsiE family protein [Pseudomonadota bacterium]|nr:phosphate-starvation-inducible PsiE family protein [Pseudomonadota bacterium]
MDNTEPINVASYKTFILNHEWHSRIIGFLVGVLMIALYVWVLSGIISILINLYHCFLSDWSYGAEHMIKKVLVVLALLEFIRVLQSYLLLGRVKLTFILEVALVVLIGELIGFWYRDFNFAEVVLGVVVISVLITLRIVTTKFSPDSCES